MASYGVDMVIDRQKNKTINTSDFGSNNKSRISTETSAKGYGLGPRFTISFRISEKIWLGTEATYYFKSIKSEQVVESVITNQIFDPTTGQVITQITKEKDETDGENKRFTFSAPAVIFLIVRW